MGLNETPSANRIHIGIFGKTNSGKSSLLNAVSGQEIAVVSDVAGTTTDPVVKAMEWLPLGPVLLTDTAGVDDEGGLGELRMEKTYQALRKTDIALLVTDGSTFFDDAEKNLLKEIDKRKIPCMVVINKEDSMTEDMKEEWKKQLEKRAVCFVSALTGSGIEELKVSLGQLFEKKDKTILCDLIQKDDVVILVTPIDDAAPKGRLILPQQQVIRELLEIGAVTMVVQLGELGNALKLTREKPRLVITDSQVFSQVSNMLPESVLLTSFSILFARYKGILWDAVAGAKMLDNLADGDKVLISEGCSHHRQCGDIGRDKLPAWIKKHTGKELEFAWSSGVEFPEDLTRYRLVVHCGGCMLNDKEMSYRLATAKEQKVAMTNYGTAIAHMNGILERSLKVYES